VNAAAHRACRVVIGRHPHASAGVIDIQTARTGPRGGPAGSDPFKKTRGRKRHLGALPPGLDSGDRGAVHARGARESGLAHAAARRTAA
jgi:hypothetical protein